jgi:hypothetical protein
VLYKNEKLLYSDFRGFLAQKQHVPANRKPPRDKRIPGGSYWHLLETPFHHILQKVRGWVRRFFVNEG